MRRAVDAGVFCVLLRPHDMWCAALIVNVCLCAAACSLAGSDALWRCSMRWRKQRRGATPCSSTSCASEANAGPCARRNSPSSACSQPIAERTYEQLSSAEQTAHADRV